MSAVLGRTAAFCSTTSRRTSPKGKQRHTSNHDRARFGTDLSKLDFGVAGTRVKLVGLRRRIAEHMVESKKHIPHYSYIDECDFSDVVRCEA